MSHISTTSLASDRVKKVSRARAFSPARLGIYFFLLSCVAFFLLPVWIMLMTSIKSMDEISLGNVLAFANKPTIEPWITAWSGACTGLSCNGIHGGFINSLKITFFGVIFSVAIGALNGYALSFWNAKGAKLLFGIMLTAAFIPYQIFIYPLVRVFSTVGLYNSLSGIVLVHTVFGMPIMTLLFRNYFASLPLALFNAARIDGAGFFMIFRKIMLPMSTPMIVVAVILQATSIWNDFLFGLTFAGRENMPMTVLLNNIVGSTEGNQPYNIQMAATLITTVVPMLIYLLSGRWFVRGIAAGAVKG
ncbi:carbohydrate ABC transporter permease [Pantoea vagans]|uniref:carbohydrate ABC transporter permease n=1 Tax=Pantoea vagans TaxID=470934 RepID=UPI003015D367